MAELRPEEEEEGGLVLMAVPQGAREPRTLRLSRRQLRRTLVFSGLLALFLVSMAGSWWYLAARAWEARELETRLRAAETDLERIEHLAGALVEVETAYDNLRSLFGPSQGGSPGEVWLPPPAGTRPEGLDPATEGPPDTWPLTQRGFITQSLLAGETAGRDHLGIDIAVPAGSYVRAAGAAVVSEVAEDPVYGLHVVLDHDDAYRTLYGHLSYATVTRGERVRGAEVIGLSGSSGRSSAPHLHFEILRDGEPVDPLAQVQRP